MAGGGCGGVSGEVMKKHLTIGKADKHWDLELFGEVLAYFSDKTFSVAVGALTEIVSTVVADGF